MFKLPLLFVQSGARDPIFQYVSVKHAILGLLVERRSYGYELMQRLEERLGPAWQLNPSTVYAALGQLEAGELAVCCSPAPPTASPRPRGRDRRVMYEVTPSGRNAFEQWVRRPSVRQEPIRSELLLKVITARAQDIPGLLEAVDHAEALAATFHEECNTAFAASEGRHPDLAREAALFRLEAELRWLRKARRSLVERRSQSEERERLQLWQVAVKAAGSAGHRY